MENISSDGSDYLKPFVRYLFEYKENQRIRNTGFVKVQKDESKTIVHIHGQGFRLGAEQMMKVYVYEMEGDIPVGIYQGMIDNINPSIHYILTFTPEDMWNVETYEKIQGIILRTESGRVYAASWNDMPVHAGEMVVRSQEMRELEPTFTEAIVQEVMQDAESDREEEAPCEEENACEEETLCEEENPCEEEKYCERETHVREDDVKDCVSDKPEEPKEKTESGKPNVRKITRQEIALLPRCEWRLANNSFLLHGYYNYHYLVLIEEEDGLWLGVPGVYHKREEKAAQNFGFSSFLKVSDEEKEPFGYWCRKVRQKIQR
ncbi:MAG: hypothetical protein Q4B75_01695 [Eubacteriales bacterium]|nr:hypothetical protein [Eubacteriales bacterium]